MESPIAPVPTNLPGCWLQIARLRLKTHAVPARPLSQGPPTMTVLPFEDNETDEPCWAKPLIPAPTSFGPCWVQKVAPGVNTHAAPAFPLS